MLAFDATRDGEAMINEFFTKYYGAAAESMKQLYRELEAVKFDLKITLRACVLEPNTKISHPKLPASICSRRSGSVRGQASARCIGGGSPRAMGSG